MALSEAPAAADAAATMANVVLDMVNARSKDRYATLAMHIGRNNKTETMRQVVEPGRHIELAKDVG